MILGLGGQSCEHNSYDIQGNPANLFYFRAGRPINNLSFYITRTPIGGAGDLVLIKQPVYSTLPVTVETVVEVGVDNSMIEVYNLENGTTYEPIPENVINFVKSSVTFKVGETISSDSIEFCIPKETYMDLESPLYMCPIKIKNVSNGVVSELNEMNTINLFIESSYENINQGAQQEEMQGTQVLDTSTWTILYNNQVFPDYTKAFDGNFYTALNFKESNPTVILDLGKEYDLTGLKLANTYWANPTYNFTSVAVELSLDSQSWLAQGTATTFSYTDYYQNIIFYDSVKARYIKMTYTWGRDYDWVMALSELAVFALDI